MAMAKLGGRQRTQVQYMHAVGRLHVAPAANMKRSRRGSLLSGAPVAAAAAAALAICETTTPCCGGGTNTCNDNSPTSMFPPASATAGFNIFAEAAPASPFPYREEQPDGRQTPSLHMVGGPRHHYEEDEAGFVVVNEVDLEEADDQQDQDEDLYYRSTNQFGGGLLSSFGGGGGLRTQTKNNSDNNDNKKRRRRKRKWKVYADVNSKTGQLQSSHVKVGRANPRKAGLQFHLRPQGDQALRGEFCYWFSFGLHVRILLLIFFCLISSTSRCLHSLSLSLSS